MELLEKTLDISALIVQLIGGGLMYYYSPENTAKLPTMLSAEFDVTTYKTRNKRLKTGFLILSFGILISLVSLIIKDFLVPTDI